MRFINFRVVGIILMSLLLGCGCGGGGGDGSDNSLNISTVGNQEFTNMVVDEVYPVYRGDTIVKDSENTVIEINTDRETGESVAILREGKAHIE